MDFFELKLAFENRGVHVTNEEITQMINDADAIDVDTDVPRVPGKVDFEEFEEMLSSHCTAKSANNWRTILEKVPLVKGAKKAISRLHEMNVKKSNGNVTEGEGTIRKDQTQSSVESSPSPLHQDTSQFIPVEKINLSFVPLPSTHQSRIHPWLPSLTGSPSFHSYVHDPSIKLPVNTAPLSEREQALRNVKWSLSMLSGIAFFRYVVTKL